ncbi:MAG: hypothetical protein AAB037_03300 [Chloroflexota bacterium]
MSPLKGQAGLIGALRLKGMSRDGESTVGSNSPITITVATVGEINRLLLLLSSNPLASLPFRLRSIVRINVLVPGLAVYDAVNTLVSFALVEHWL